eukprot:evm.model.NODE_8241_length_3392_cov_20.112324.3
MRTRSLLAWLGGFEARVAAAISEDGDNAIALGLLQSGQVLWNVMDQLHNEVPERSQSIHQILALS